MIHYTKCPLCGNEQFAQRYEIKDFSISGETFPVCACDRCGLLFTQDVPAEDESAKYYQAEQYISHSDTAKGIVNQLYHTVRKQTLKDKQKLIERISGKQKGNLLDIGSGTGGFLHTMQSAGWNVTGIEPDEIARKNARTLHQLETFDSGHLQSLENKSFDVITMWHVLEHVHQLDYQMKELHRLLKDNGVIFIAVPNHTSYDAEHYGTFWAAWDVPRHLYHFSPGSMNFLAEKYHFTITDKKLMMYDSFYVSLLSEKYKSGKSNFLKAFYTGAVSNRRAKKNPDRCSSLIYVLRKK
ncbi:MAG: class I SAM-dependent methyltransferase [Chitinophagaceae bacterium]|nr:class I SAM-dependent methyltransferase [Chitinophagaceae bacterium]